MKSFIRRALAHFSCLLVFTAPPALLAQGIAKPESSPARVAKSATSSRTTPPADAPRVGDVQVLDDQRIYQEAELQRDLARFKATSKTITIHSSNDNKLLMVAAPSTNRSFHFPSSYLLGRTPYKVTERWMPLYIISEHIRYQPDNEHFPGREEVWLTTMQTWEQANGDCEDHAILLADWLIELGLDARVVLGQHNDAGHAWVVVIKDGNEYLLEATLKHYLERWAAYPLTSLLPEYHPAIMFNRNDLWVNSGSKLTTSYSSEKWKKSLHFTPTS